jgi:hypothetical protein
MNITIGFTSLTENRPHEYVLRFVFGGLITALAGWIATRFGPVIGGLFLAFPSIFPATVTLIERHEARKKAELGMAGEQQARCAAGADAAGAAIGSLGLAMYGLIVWQYASDYEGWIVLSAATLVWFLVACAIWVLRKKF